MPLLFYFFSQGAQGIIKYRTVKKRDQYPRNGIGNKKSEKTAIRRKYSIDPENAENTGSEKGDDHGTESISQSAQSAVESFHDADEHVGGEHDLCPLHGPVDDFGVRVENRHDLIAEDIKCPADDGAQYSGTHKTPQGASDHPFIVACSFILSDKCHGGVKEGNRTDVKYSLHPCLGGAACHGIGTERVDGRLDDQIGNRKKGALNGGRDTDLKHILYE